ncbi:hypothetical protein ACFOD9_01500 [Novosphingobium bradum]|uniref:Uncharacterized protein n=1 Tax=Novosphingobium bradum TaxID=1737444 RepID=A0ABV7IJQ0_9SPHN
MTATIITFPTVARRAEGELYQAGSNPLERAIDKARNIAATIIADPRRATLPAELEELAGLVRRLEPSHPLHMDDLAIIPFGPGPIYCPLRGVPEMLAGILAGLIAA